LDATNIVNHPLLSVITSIGLEHTHILGDTLEKIALEKGGIIKDGCPVLVGNNLPKLVIKQCAEERKASAFYECDDVLGDEESNSNDKALDYDAENSRIATAALTLLSAVLTEKPILDQIISKGVKARPPCRFEEISVSTDNARQVTAILDVAHNPQAIEQLFSKIQSKYPGASARIVVGMSADKDIRKCSDIILDFVSDPSKVHLVESSNPRAASVATILECNPVLKDSHHQSSTESMNETESSVAVQVKKAIDLASANNEVLVVCGTFFIMSEARSCLGINEPRDREVVSNVTGDKKYRK
jgi:dihydrofolate synthase/folylpolyglutamate synthase